MYNYTTYNGIETGIMISSAEDLKNNSENYITWHVITPEDYPPESRLVILYKGTYKECLQYIEEHDVYRCNINLYDVKGNEIYQITGRYWDKWEKIRCFKNKTIYPTLDLISNETIPDEFIYRYLKMKGKDTKLFREFI